MILTIYGAFRTRLLNLFTKSLEVFLLLIIVTLKKSGCQRFILLNKTKLTK